MWPRYFWSRICHKRLRSFHSFSSTSGVSKYWPQSNKTKVFRFNSGLEPRSPPLWDGGMYTAFFYGPAWPNSSSPRLPAAGMLPSHLYFHALGKSMCIGSPPTSCKDFPQLCPVTIIAIQITAKSLSPLTCIIFLFFDYLTLTELFSSAKTV